MKRNYKTLEEFVRNLHDKGFTIINYDNKPLPCIFINPSKYNEVLSKTSNKKYVINSLLDIFYDGRDCFVDVVLKFSDLDIEENYLFHANESLDFFNSLYETGMMGLLSAETSLLSNHESNIFVIQLPNKDKIRKAIDIIRKNVYIQNS